ncbi:MULTISPECIES: response regulator [Niastella]|uniref:Response regulator n=1 Tax=Niastella soli TaxID=2821487 RepID=A0ABS3Z450_9BACT|nr:response regulator [Niastella soli]MBO9204944.1 response regulator [Niastella soli]
MDFPEKVLLIDDDEEEHFIFTVALKECCPSIKLICEKNAGSALARMANYDASSTPNMIILDWRMPHISGKEVLIRIRKLPQYAKIPVVIFTGIFEPLYFEEAKELGATFFLRKPFDFLELCRKLAYLFTLDWRDPKSPGQQI